MKKKFFFLLACFFLLASCAKNEEPIVNLQTSEGDIQIKLYKQTPLHRDNFVKLVEEGFFDGQLFHRVLKDYMLQAGDPNSRTADRNRLLGEQLSEFTLPAELDSTTSIMKKGALVALNLALLEGQVDQTDAHLFSIIIGRKYTLAELDSLERANYDIRLEQIFQNLVVANRSRIDYLSLKVNDEVKLAALQDSLVQIASKQIEKDRSYFFTEAQRRLFTSQGGLPERVNDYTVFGEVISGLELIDKINLERVDRHARPQKDIRIIKATIVK